MNKAIAGLALLVASSALPQPVAAQDIPGPQIGQPAPPITAKGLDGRTVTLADYHGKVLVLNFWATWCPPCRVETPDMIAAYRKLSGKGGVQFLGLDSTEQPPVIHAFIAAKGLNYPVALDQDKKTSGAYDVRGIPTTYVIDGNGIVRARFVDVISVPQLTSFVDAAKQGHNGVIASAVQRKIDETLNPSRFAYPTDYQGVLTAVKAATDAVNKSNDLVGNADPAKGEITDYLKTRAEQSAVLNGAIAALSKVAKSTEDHALLYRMQGDLATNNEQWPEAIAAYQKSLATNVPGQQHADALDGLAFAYYEQKNWRPSIQAYEQIVATKPDPSTYVTIGKLYLELKDYPNAIAAERKGAEIADRAAARQKSSDNLVDASHSWLYLGRAYQTAGDNANAHMAFLKSQAYAQQLPHKSGSYARYIELSQEADVSLALGANGKTTVSLVPWTGADLPGSIPNTIKYRLVVASHPGSTVQLKATGLAKGWIASFCTDKICAPMQRTVTLPESGVKIVEFQLIPNDPAAAKHTNAKVQATSTSGNATSSTVVASK